MTRPAEPGGAGGPAAGLAGTSARTLGVHALRLGVQVALLLALANWLGAADFGEYAALTALGLGLGACASFGLGFRVLAVSARSPEAGRRVLASAIGATLLSAVLLLPLYLVLAVGVLDSAAGAAPLLLIGLSELLLVPLLALLGHRQHGLGRVSLSQFVLWLPMVLRLAGLGLLVAAGRPPSLEHYAPVHGAGALLALGAVWLGSRPPGGRLPWPARPRLAVLRSGLPYAAMNFTAGAPTEIDKALALRLLGAGETGLYALGARGLAVVTLPVMALVQAALPRLLGAPAAGNAASVALARWTVALALTYGLLAAVLLHLVLAPLLHWALAPGFAGIGPLVGHLALAAPFMSLRVAAGALLFAAGRPGLRSALEGGGSVLLAVLALLLAPALGWAGLVWAVIAAEAFMALLGLLAALRVGVLGAGGRAPRPSSPA